jgi:hypothetical protein
MRRLIIVSLLGGVGVSTVMPCPAQTLKEWRCHHCHARMALQLDAINYKKHRPVDLAQLAARYITYTHI